MNWSPIDKAPMSGSPFWLGTGTGGVMLEAWHWCSERNDFSGVFSGTTLTELRKQAPIETFFFAEMKAPSAFDLKRRQH